MNDLIRTGIVFASLILHLIFAFSARAQTEENRRIVQAAATLRLFAAPDESSPQMELSRGNDRLFPLAELIGSMGTKWYLVRTQSGARGWIKGGDSDEAKTTENFFKTLPMQPISIISVPSASAARRPILVPIHMTGTAAFVTVTLNRMLQVSMLLDTGASYTVVSRQVAANLRLGESSRSSISTANGPITVPLAHLSSIKVGEAEALDLTVAIHDLFTNATLDGLLGLDFLSRFQTSIDSRRQMLILSPR